MTLFLQVHHKSLSLGEVLDGDRMAESLYHIQFKENIEKKKTVCQLTLSEKQVCVSLFFLLFRIQPRIVVSAEELLPFPLKCGRGSSPPFCNLVLNSLMFHVSQVDQLREAIEELYYFEFVVDDIPIWGFVGYIEESGFLPHSHKVSLLYVCMRWQQHSDLVVSL